MRASAQLSDAPIADEKRLERADPRHRLDRAILAQQRSHAPAVDAEDGPIRLLADVGARVRARGPTAARCRAKNAFASAASPSSIAAGCMPASTRTARARASGKRWCWMSPRARSTWRTVRHVQAVVGELQVVARGARAGRPAHRHARRTRAARRASACPAAA